MVLLVLFNAAIDACQHGNVTLSVAGDSEFHGLGLGDDTNYETLSPMLDQPLPDVNFDLISISLDYEGHDDISDAVTELGFEFSKHQWSKYWTNYTANYFCISITVAPESLRFCLCRDGL